MRNVDVLMQPGIRDSFWADQIHHGIEDGARIWRDTVRLYPRAADAADALEGAQPRPILLAGNSVEWLETNIRAVALAGAQPVVVNASMMPEYRLCCSGVVFELENMVRACRSYLEQCGRRRIAFVGPIRDSVTDRVKCGAFGNPGHIFPANGPVEECTRQFVRLLPETGYDAALCANDTAALCLMRCLKAQGYRLPEDFFVIGMGNSYLGAHLEAPLTSVMFDYRQMGEQAVNLYHTLLERGVPCHETLALPCRLIVRQSTGNIPAMPNQPEMDAGSRSVPDSGYFSGPEGREILGMEALLQSCSATDREILFRMMRGESCERIAEQVYFTARAVRYRLAHMVHKGGFESREALIEALRSALGMQEGKSEHASI